MIFEIFQIFYDFFNLKIFDFQIFPKLFLKSWKIFLISTFFLEKLEIFQVFQLFGKIEKLNFYGQKKIDPNKMGAEKKVHRPWGT